MHRGHLPVLTGVRLIVEQPGLVSSLPRLSVHLVLIVPLAVVAVVAAVVAVVAVVAGVAVITVSRELRPTICFLGFAALLDRPAHTQ